MSDIEIFHEPTENEPFVIINKPSTMPSAPIKENDDNNALYFTAKRFPEILSVSGKKTIEHGLLHRIDNVTSGLLMIATEQSFYDKMLINQKNNDFVKTYSAECNLVRNNSVILKGYPLEKPSYLLEKNNVFEISSYFRFYKEGRKEVRPVTEKDSKVVLSKVENKKIYTTKVKILRIEEKKVFVECEITQGFKHQVRCHLSWCDIPIENDCLYNCYCDEKKDSIKFKASKLSFTNPVNNKNFSIEL